MSSSQTIKFLEKLGQATLIALCVIAVVGWALDSDCSTTICRGDIPGFIGPATMIARGLGSQLYDFELQRTIQNELWPSLGGRFFISLYPPTLSLFLTPLTFFPAPAAALIFVFCNLIALCFAVRLIRNANRALHPFSPLGLTGLSLLFAPIYFGVFGGQNTALSMLLAALLASPAARTRGVAAALWLFKPQFGLPMGIFASIKRSNDIQRVALKIFSVGILLTCLLGVFVVHSWDWVAVWFNAGKTFAALNYTNNSSMQTSLLGAAAGLNDPFFLSLMLCLTVAIACWLLREAFHSPQRALPLWLAALPLLSPQTLFYDLGIAVVGYLLVAKLNRRCGITALAALCYGMAGIYLRENSSFPVFFPLAIFIFLATLGERTRA